MVESIAIAPGGQTSGEFARYVHEPAKQDSIAANRLWILMRERHSRTFRGADLRFLLLLTPLELVLYRPVLFWAQFKGMIEFLRGDRSWNKFSRNARTPAIP